jgi:hypothetical protein
MRIYLDAESMEVKPSYRLPDSRARVRSVRRLFARRMDHLLMPAGVRQRPFQQTSSEVERNVVSQPLNQRDDEMKEMQYQKRRKWTTTRDCLR